MHQIKFQLRLRSRLRWGSLQGSPDPIAGGEGGRERRKREGKREKGRGWEEMVGKKKGREGRRRGLSSVPPSSKFATTSNGHYVIDQVTELLSNSVEIYNVCRKR